eukprot:m.156691 g.156691  ORF g.156691 m.156691 type:complete len:2039 (-) comp15102_c0_seq1:220-6336(-)
MAHDVVSISSDSEEEIQEIQFHTIMVTDHRPEPAIKYRLNLDEDSNLTQLISSLRKVVPDSEGVQICIANNEDKVTDLTEETFPTTKNLEKLYVFQNPGDLVRSKSVFKASFQPHHNTIVKSGAYEYFASNGRNPLAYAMAELVDNSLAATSRIPDTRKIEIQWYRPNAHQASGYVIVWDNGIGMDEEGLESWAKFRNQQDERKDKARHQANPDPDTVRHRYLNSNISFFGAGGKQAIFYIGESVHMITKKDGRNDVIEGRLSKRRFEKRKKAGQEVFSETWNLRRPGELFENEEYGPYKANFASRENSKHFTAVIIEVQDSQKTKQLSESDSWEIELARIYHYYIHGPNGNSKEEHVKSSLVDISVNGRPLFNVCDDYETKCIRESVESMEFMIEISFANGTDVVEGCIRYHPFRNGAETHPREEETSHREDTFQSYWNGRFVPHSSIPSLPFCEKTRYIKDIGSKCYDRLSGTLFFGGSNWAITTNKYSFLEDAEKRLASAEFFELHTNKAGKYERKTAKISRQNNLSESFHSWLANCHKKYDREMHFYDSSESGKLLENVAQIKRRSEQNLVYTVFRLLKFSTKEGKEVEITKDDVIKIGMRPPRYYVVEKLFLQGNYKKNDGPYHYTSNMAGYILGRQIPLEYFGDSHYMEVRNLTESVSKSEKNPIQLHQKIEKEDYGKVRKALLSKGPAALSIAWLEGKGSETILLPDYQLKTIERYAPFPGHFIQLRTKSKDLVPRELTKNFSIKRLFEVYINDEWVTRANEDQPKFHPGLKTGQIDPQTSGFYFNGINRCSKSGRFRMKFYLQTKFEDQFDVKPLELEFRVSEGTPARFKIKNIEPLDDASKVPKKKVVTTIPAEGLFRPGIFQLGKPILVKGEFLDALGAVCGSLKRFKPVVRITVENTELNCNDGAKMFMSPDGTMNVLIKPIPNTDVMKDLDLKGKKIKLNLSCTLEGVNDIPEVTRDITIHPGCPADIKFCNKFGSEGKVIHCVDDHLNLPDLRIKDSWGFPAVTPTDKFSVCMYFRLGEGDKTYDTRKQMYPRPSSGKRPPKEANIHFKGKQAGPAQLIVEIGKATARKEMQLTPTCHVAEIGIYYKNKKCTKKSELLLPAGEPLPDLKFKLLTEMGSPVDLAVAYKKGARIQWADKEIDQETFLRGTLPSYDIAPQSITSPKQFSVTLNIAEKKFTTFALFTVKAKPGNPHQMDISIEDAAIVNEELEESNQIEIVFKDAFENVCDVHAVSKLGDPQLENEDIDVSSLVSGKDSSFVWIRGVKFTKVGTQRVKLIWGSISKEFHVEVLPGTPKFVEYTSFPCELTEGYPFGEAFELSLVDENRNPCRGTSEDVPIILTLSDCDLEFYHGSNSSKSLQIFPSVKSTFTYTIPAFAILSSLSLDNEKIVDINARIILTKTDKSNRKRSKLDVFLEGMPTSVKVIPDKSQVKNVKVTMRRSADEKQEELEAVKIGCDELPPEVTFSLLDMLGSPIDKSNASGKFIVHVTYPNLRSQQFPLELSDKHDHATFILNPQDLGPLSKSGPLILAGEYILSRPISKTVQAPKKIIDVEHGKPECINMHRTEHMGPICIRGSHDPIIKNATLHVFDKNQNICTSVNLEAACTILNDSDQPSNLELENSKISFTDGTVQNVTITITNQEVPEGTYVLRMEPIDFSDFKLAPFQKPFKSFNEIERKRKYETLSDALNKCLQEEQSLKSRIDNNQEAMNRADGSCQQALESFTQQINLYNVTHKENCSANGEDIPDFSEMVERHKDVMRDSARRRQKGRKLQSSHPDAFSSGVFDYVSNLFTVENDTLCQILLWDLGRNTEVLVCNQLETARRLASSQRTLATRFARHPTTNFWLINQNKGPPPFPPDNGEYLMRYIKFPTDYRSRYNDEIHKAVANFMGSSMLFRTYSQAASFRERRKGMTGRLYYLEPDIGRIQSDGTMGGSNSKPERLDRYKFHIGRDTFDPSLDAKLRQLENLKNAQIVYNREYQNRKLAKEKGGENPALRKQSRAVAEQIVKLKSEIANLSLPNAKRSRTC